jgi:ankyrin repeat protein
MTDLYEDPHPETFYLAPKCGLEIKPNFDASEHSQDFGSEYEVLNINDLPLISNPEVSKGWLSPLGNLTLPLKVRRALGIPAEAKKFCFVYPPRGLADHIDWGNVSAKGLQKNQSSHKWAMPYVASFGAFAYFDEKSRILSVNAITLVKTPYEIKVEGPFLATDDAYEEMNNLNRYQALYLDVFREVNYTGSAWIDPGESRFIDKEAVGQSNIKNYHGGFLYFRHDKKAVLLLLTGSHTSLSTPPSGVASLLLDAFRLCKHQLKTNSLRCTVGGSRKTEMHRACELGYKEHVLQHITENNNPKRLLQTVDSFGWNPLHYACCYQAQNDELISILVETCPQSIFASNKNRMYPIHLACQNGASLKVIKLLLENDRSRDTLKNKTMNHEFLPIHYACSNSRITIDVMRYLINAHHPTVFERTKLGWSILHRAIAANHKEQIIEEILRASDSDSTVDTYFPLLFDKVNGLLPIHLACRKSASVEIVSALIEADPSDKTFYDIVESCTEYRLQNASVLHILFAHSTPDVIELALKKEVGERCMPSENMKDLFEVAELENGMLPLHVACTREDLGIKTMTTILRLRRKSITEKDFDGNTPLHLICKNKDVDAKLIELLLKTEKEITHRWRPDHSAKHLNKDKKTALNLALKAGAVGAYPLLAPEIACFKELKADSKQELTNLVVEQQEYRNNIVKILAERQYFALLMFELVANIATTIVYIRVTSKLTLDGTSTINLFELVILFVCLTVFFTRELIQSRGSPLLEYVLDPWNLAEVASILSLLAASIHLVELWLYNDVEQMSLLFNVTGVLLLLQFIFIVRTTFLPFARFVAGLFQITVALLPFVVVSALLLLAFTYSFLIRKYEGCSEGFAPCFYFTLYGFFYGIDDPTNNILDVVFGVIAVVIL